MRDLGTPSPSPPNAEPVEGGGIAITGALVLWRQRSALLALGDVATVLAAVFLSARLRNYVAFGADGILTAAAPGGNLRGGLVLAGIWVFLIWRDGGYEPGLRGVGAPMLRARSLLVCGCYAIGIALVTSSLHREFLLSRQVVLTTGALGTGGMAALRVVVRFLERRLAARGVVGHRVVVVGLGPQVRMFAAMLERQSPMYRVIGFLTTPQDGPDAPATFMERPVLGELDTFEAVHRHAHFGTLILSSAAIAPGVADAEPALTLELVNFCEANDVALYTIPGAFSVTVAQREVGSLSGVPLIRLRDASLHPVYAVVKRLADLSVAATGIVLGLPLWLLIALAIKLSDGGPVLFRQRRCGLHGRPFTMVKFRTMVVDAEDRLGDLVDIDALDVPGFKVANDPRVTRLGRVLRRTSLDEMPQLLNVISGEMSLVGPRPELPELVARYTPLQRRRVKAKPGMTGLQQIRARGEPLAACLKYDLAYLKHQGLLLDLYILYRTVWVVVRGTGVTH